MISKLRFKLWRKLTRAYPRFLRKVYGMDIADDCIIAMSAHLDKSVYPQGIHIGRGTYVLRESMILSHDACRSFKADTYIGENCVVGIRSIVLPGLSIGNQVVIGGEHRD